MLLQSCRVLDTGLLRQYSCSQRPMQPQQTNHHHNFLKVMFLHLKDNLLYSTQIEPHYTTNNKIDTFSQWYLLCKCWHMAGELKTSEEVQIFQEMAEKICSKFHFRFPTMQSKLWTRNMAESTMVEFCWKKFSWNFEVKYLHF